MKSVFKQKNEPVLSRSVKSSETLTQLPNHRLNVAAAASSEGPRRTRTSAAMLGLAISVSATGMLLPGRSHKAVAAEPMVAEHNVEKKSLEKQPKVSSAPKAPAKEVSATLIKKKQQVKAPVSTSPVKQVRPPKVPSVVPPASSVKQSRLRTSSSHSPTKASVKPKPSVTSPAPSSVTPTPQQQSRQSSSPVARANPQVVKYQVKEGDTLWQLSQKYGIKPEDIAASSQISTHTILSIGQSLQIPNFTGQSNQSPAKKLVSSVNLPVGQDEAITGTISKLSKPKSESNPDSLQPSYRQINENLTKLPTLKPENLTTLAPNATSLSSEGLVSGVRGNRAEQSVVISVPLPQIADTSSIPGKPTSFSDTGKLVAIPLQVGETVNREPSSEQVLELAIPTYKPGKIQAVGNIDRPTPIITASEVIRPQIYQVQSGDTLNEIADQYGIPSSELMQFNGLTNPDLININQKIKIPKAEGELLRTTQTLANFSDPSIVLASANAVPEQLRVENSQVANSGDETVVTGKNFDDAIETTVGGNNGASNSSVIISNLTPQQAASPTYDPYIEKLKANIIRMREESRSQDQQSESEELTVSVPVAPSLNNAISIPIPARSVNPEWQQDSNNQVQGSVKIPVELRENTPQLTNSPSTASPQESSQQQLVATAPMPVESYNGLINTPVGEMVSPELPPLQSPDQYLPSSPDSFNGYVWPTKGVLTSGYGWRWGRMHKGIDIAAPVGTPIYAVAPGEVISSGWNSGGYGNLVKIRHPNGSITLYAHNSRLNVRRGQQVTQGQKIAEMGSTGYSTGPHLHFELHPQGGGAVNPIAYLPSR